MSNGLEQILLLRMKFSLLWHQDRLLIELCRCSYSDKGSDVRLQDLLSKSNLQQDSFPWDWVEDEVLSDCEKASDEKLPRTGMSEEVDKALSSIFIQPMHMLGKAYGTQSQTVIVGWQDNMVQVHEKITSRAIGTTRAKQCGILEFCLSVPITDTWRTSAAN